MAYVWLFYDSADWSMPIITLYIVHSLLWLHCSLIQLGGKDQGLISHFYVCFIFHNPSVCVQCALTIPATPTTSASAFLCFSQYRLHDPEKHREWTWM